MKLKLALTCVMTTALLSGCASVDQDTLVDASTLKKARALQPTVATATLPDDSMSPAEMAAARPTLPSPAQMAAAIDAPVTGMVPAAAPADSAMTAMVPEDPAASAARAALTAQAPAPGQLPAGPSPVSVASADMPFTAEVAALSTGVPTPMPRPGSAAAGTELAYASAALPVGNASAFDSFSSYDTSAPSQLPAPEISDSSVPRGPNSALDGLIKKYASIYEVPEKLVHRVVKRESSYNPKAYSRGNYGLMQIRYNTAKSMGYQGTPAGLLDAETNLKYAVKYLRGAFVVADNSHENAVKLYARGYYYDAKRKGLLHLVK